jgi:hypothetical protein
VLLAGGVWLAGRIGAHSETEAEPFAVIDPRFARLDGYAEFVDDRWRPALAARLASLPEVSAEEPEPLEPIRATLASLPFVAEVGVGSVLWPDGYRVAVRLRKPAACLHVAPSPNAGSPNAPLPNASSPNAWSPNGGYLLVAEDGVVLPGEWKRPPWVAGGWLPVLGPLEEPARGSDASLRPGARIAERRHLDALAVAVSMRAALAADDFEALGAPVIDATNARSASVTEPGVVIQLEEGRRVLFGRAPNAGEPGELPVEQKWASLAKAARTLGPESGDRRDWSALDVRWDVPDILWRDAPPETANGEAPKAEAAKVAALPPTAPPVAPIQEAPKPKSPDRPLAPEPRRSPPPEKDSPRDPPTNKPRVL